MAQFTPHWDLKADTNIITEGGTTYVRISINRDKVSDPDVYEITNDQYLELTYQIKGTGETLEDRDFTITVGEDINNLKPLGYDGSPSGINGTHKVKLQKKSFKLTTLTKDVYFIKVHCNVDGVWDGPESLQFFLNEINVVTLIDDQIANVESSGSIGNNTATIAYDNSTEIWVTPSLIVRDELYSISEMHFGSNSRTFVQAFGKSRKYIEGVDSRDDDSNRVFYPDYRILDLPMSSIPSTHRTGKGTTITPDSTVSWPPESEEMPVVIIDELGNKINSGLKFNSNGQFLGTFLYESDPIDAYFRVRIIAPTDLYKTEKDAFYIGKRFKAYQMWVCPQDVSYIQGSPIPGHLYQLKNTIVYPYVIKDVYDSGVQKAVFDSTAWNDLGYYSAALGSGIIGQERTFRMIVNASTGDGIDFITDKNLGAIHVGEYFGHTVYPKIQATGTLVTYEIAASSRDDITKYNLDLAADGTLVGTAYARAQDFTTNDEIKLEFDVKATDKSGASITSTFELRIIRGFGQNFLSAYIKPSAQFERKWFSTISTNQFANQYYYRGVDDRYGVQKTPKILLKENFVSSTYPYTTLSAMKKTLRDNVINTTNGAPVPTGIFGFVMGNYKIRSALDSLGNVLYDVLYREIHPAGTSVSVSIDPFIYTIQDTAFLSEFFGLRENIFKAVGEDVTNLLSDPTDFQNRGITVPMIPGLSSEMIDTVPRYMNHPYLEDGMKAEFLPVIPVAYFNPGQAEAFFNKLVRSNEHQTLVNEEFNITYVEFQYFFQEYSKYVQNNYTIQIKEQNRLGG